MKYLALVLAFALGFGVCYYTKPQYNVPFKSRTVEYSTSEREVPVYGPPVVLPVIQGTSITLVTDTLYKPEDCGSFSIDTTFLARGKTSLDTLKFIADCFGKRVLGFEYYGGSFPVIVRDSLIRITDSTYVVAESTKFLSLNAYLVHGWGLSLLGILPAGFEFGLTGNAQFGNLGLFVEPNYNLGSGLGINAGASFTIY